MTIHGRKAFFRCCQNKISVRRGTILEGSKISVRKFILLAYSFVNPTLTYSQVQEQTTVTSDEDEEDSETKENEPNVPKIEESEEIEEINEEMGEIVGDQEDINEEKEFGEEELGNEEDKVEDSVDSSSESVGGDSGEQFEEIGVLRPPDRNFCR